MKLAQLLREILGDKTIARILFNWEVEKQCQNLTGVMIDLACGENPSYHRFWTISPDKFIRVDSNERASPDVLASLNEPLPFANDFADHVFLFNAIYILEKPEDVIKEACRILRDGGRFYLLSPFVFNEAPEPHDYYRFTSEKLTGFLHGAGFQNIEIIPLGDRFSSAAYLLTPFVPKLVRFPFYAISLFLDWRLSKRKRRQRCPVSYFCLARKQKTRGINNA